MAQTHIPRSTEQVGRRYSGRTQAERHAERRGRLLECGLEAFGTKGFDSTSIDQLCVAAGVATRSFYEVFDSREAVLIALHDDVNARAYNAVIEALGAAPDGDIELRVKAAMDAYLSVMTRDERFLRIVTREMVGATSATHAARRVALQQFVGLIGAEAQNMVVAGLRPPRDGTLAAVALVGAITALIETLGSGSDRQRIARVQAEAVRLIVTVLSNPDP